MWRLAPKRQNVKKIPALEFVYYHTGGAPGASCSMHILDEGKTIVVVLTNDAPTWRGDKLADFIALRIAATQ